MTATLAPANLNEQVYEALRRRLLQREFKPGDKLSLHELASELGVSRSPVHHALTRLVEDGLLSVKARRGYYVTPITAGALTDAYDVRLALELQAAETVVGRAEEDELAELGRLCDETAKTLDGTRLADPDGFDRANSAFHAYIVDLAGNSLMSKVYRELPVNLLVQAIRSAHAEVGADLEGEHRAIVDAYVAGDLDAARAAIRAHIASGKRVALVAADRAGGAL
ncbi:MAG TPA: GntR family transcriptional regulator [Gaiellaceae bacterium]|jgi:DNA-binding GntR family transcriptional regulator|nr:GntR family transcriptional regulator [Gaiellaceae bacterium]